MKHIVEYKLHGGNIPYFIEDGGYFFNNWKLIGRTKDDVSCYVPPASQLVTFASKEDFVAHISSLQMVAPDEEPGQSPRELTIEEKQVIASDWWDSKVN